MKVTTEWESTTGESGSVTYNVQNDCPHKLPCGWCKELDRPCPNQIVNVPSAWWGIYPPVPQEWTTVTCEDKKCEK